MRGRPRKPTNLKILQGNPMHESKAQLDPVREPQYASPVKGAYKVPPGLSHMAANEWKRVVRELAKLGLYQIVDRAALCSFCEAWSTFMECQAVINAEGMTYAVTNRSGTFYNKRPEVRIRFRALQQIRYFAAEFGFTPSSRGKIEIPKLPGKDLLAEALSKPRTIRRPADKH